MEKKPNFFVMLRTLIIGFSFIVMAFAFGFIAFLIVNNILLSDTKTINDPTKPQIIEMKTKTNINPYAINIHIKGEIDGKASIQYKYRLEDEDYEYNILELEDEIDIKVNSRDWYSDNCFIIYEPINVNNGKITIKIRWKGL